MTDTVLTKIVNWLTGATIFEFQADASLSAGLRLGQAFKAAVKVGASFRYANLTGANLTGADLIRANLTGANLTGADLIRANLTGANLTGADLTHAATREIRSDLFDVLLCAQPEVPGLLAALRAGKIKGSTYSGECACLVGTIANIRHVTTSNLVGINPDSSRPIERWFLAINKGDNPGNSRVAKITEDWILEFQQLIGQTSAPADGAA